MAAVVAAALLSGACGVDRQATTAAHDHADHEHGQDSVARSDPRADYLPSVDPCTLITEGEAERVLGPLAKQTEADDPLLGTTDHQRVCLLAAKDDPRFGANVGVTDLYAVTKFDGLVERNPGSEEVRGLGDRAAWLPTPRVLLVLDGSELLSVQMTDIVETDMALLKEQAVNLATSALPRLSENGAPG